MADQPVPVALRTVVGKRVRQLRRDGVLPGNIFGRGLPSVPVQMETREALQMLRTHGVSNLFTVQVEGEAEPRSVIVRDLGRDPVSRDVLHIDFYQVDLNRPIQVSVPVTLVGDAPGVTREGGILVTGIDAVVVEALPANLPASIDVSVEGLTEFDAVLTVADLEFSAEVTCLSDGELVLARIARPRLILSTAGEAEDGDGTAGEADGAGDAAADGTDADAADDAAAE